MKRYFSMISLVLLSFAMIFAGCSNAGGGADSQGEGGDKKLQVAYYVNGTLGDKGFFDSAQAGLDKAAKELAVEVKTIEGGNNQADWPAGLESLAADGKYDVILVGTSQMKDIAMDIAGRYPEENFILFDEMVSDVPNLYSMLYSQSEGSFLVGAFAALVTTSTELDGANPEKVIGFIGGMDIPIINDFKAGYEQGAQYVDADVQIIASYVGDFANAPKAKELALAQYNSQQVDISYNVAGGAGLGLLEAGKEVGKYSIGVDGNQNPLYPGSVLTSMMKNIDQSIYRALELHLKGELKYGTNEVLGLKEGGVSLAKDELYEKHVPQSIKDKMKEIEEKLSSGEIEVKSTLK